MTTKEFERKFTSAIETEIDAMLKKITNNREQAEFKDYFNNVKILDELIHMYRSSPLEIN